MVMSVWLTTCLWKASLQSQVGLNLWWQNGQGALLEFLFFQINQVDYVGVFLLKDMCFWLEAKGLNDNGYFFTNQFD